MPNKDCLDISFVRDKQEEWMTKTIFPSFAADSMRWATSGGAQSSEVLGEKNKSKWAWAISRKLV